MTLKTEVQITRLVNNIKKAVKDIKSLNKQAYDYLYLCGGFIAHYNLEGFKDYYREHSLAKDILENHYHNRYLNFTSKDKDYEYYRQKAEIYRRIVEAL